MDRELMQSAQQFHIRRRQRSIWKKLVSVLGCIVVFCTTYALILPAITMERETICGIQEHQHSDSCYTKQVVKQLVCSAKDTGVHTHSAQCGSDCGYADFVIHEHAAVCYDGSGALVCTLPQVKEHAHLSDCYRIPQIVIGQHDHTDACYSMQQAELLCALAESDGHTHTEGCMSQISKLVCEQEEGETHTHAETCYRTESVLSCGKEEMQAHHHTDDCYRWERRLSCGKEEGPIYGSGEPELICTKKEVKAHTHTAQCFDPAGKWICGQLQILRHTHSAGCFDATKTKEVLTCDLEEHTHSEECYPAPETNAAVDTTKATGATEPENTVLMTSTLWSLSRKEAAVSEIATSDDLKDFLTVVTIKDENDQTVTELLKGKDYHIYLNFLENPQLQFQQTMQYQMPSGLTASVGTSGTLQSNGMDVAAYSISQDGLLTVTFMDVETVDEAGQPVQKPWQDTIANGDITIDFTAKIDENMSGDSLSFSQNHDFTVTVPQPSLDVSKSGQFSQGQPGEDGQVTTGSIDYTVVVTARNSDVTGLTIADSLIENENETGSFSIREGSFEVKDSGGKTIEGCSVTIDSDRQGFTLTAPQNFVLRENERLTIRYSVDVTGLDSSAGGFGKGNTAVVSGSDKNSNTIQKDTTVWPWFPVVSSTVKKEIKKYGANATAGDAVDTGVIQWTVEITDGNGLAGAKFKDTMGEGLSLDTSKAVEVVFKDADGHEQPPVSIDSSKITIQTDEVSGSNILLFDFPAMEESGEVVYTGAKLTYYTNFSLSEIPPNASKEYRNTAEITKDAKNESIGPQTGAVTIRGTYTTPTTTTKKVEAKGDTLQYTIHVDVPGLTGGYSPFYVVDTMSAKPVNSDFINLTLTQSCISNVSATSNGEALSNVNWSVEDGRLYFFFNGGDSTQNSKWVQEEPAALEITYAVNLEALKAENENLAMILSEAGVLRNTAQNHYVERQSEGTVDYQQISAKISKTGVLNDGGSITYTIVVNGLSQDNKSEMANAQRLFLKDALPEGWEYDQGTMKMYPLLQYGPDYVFVCDSDSITVENGSMTVDLDKMHEAHYNASWLGSGKQMLITSNFGPYVTGLRFEYKLKPTQGWLDSLDGYVPNTVSNSAALHWDEKQTDSAQSQIQYGFNPLTKSVTQDATGSDLFHFVIDVNEKRAVLMNGGSSVTLTDTMCSLLKLDMSSLVVENFDSGERILGLEISCVSGADGNTLTIAGLPDRTHLRITYDAYATETGTVTISNTVALSGKSEWQADVTKDNVQVTSTGGAQGSTGKFFIQKVDSETKETVSGAQFKLYLVGNAPLANDLIKAGVSLDETKNGDSVGGTAYPYWYDLSDQRIWELPDKPGWYQIGYTGNDKGETQFAVDMFTNSGYRFALMETKAPEGYYLLEEPIAISYGSGMDVDYAGVFQVSNTKSTTSIKVNKEWQDQDGNPATNTTGEITIQLYQTTTPVTTSGNPSGTSSEEAVETTPTGGTPFGDPVTIRWDGISWSYTFKKLPKTITVDGNTVTCYYYVVEKADPNYHASYQNNGGIQSGSITVINKQVITYELPETGGIGTQAYTLGGFTMAAGAVLWLCYRRKRRREDG